MARISRDINGDRVAISFNVACGQLHAGGIVNEDDIIAAVRAMVKPCAGYVYADDVEAAISGRLQ